MLPLHSAGPLPRPVARRRSSGRCGSKTPNLIEARLGDLALLDGNKVAYVIREAVVAQVLRPDDATTVDVSVDDGRVSKTYRSSAGRVAIRDDWWDLLSPNQESGAFSIVPTPPYNLHLPWCSSMFGALYCSCGVDIAGEPIFELGGGEF